MHSFSGTIAAYNQPTNADLAGALLRAAGIDDNASLACAHIAAALHRALLAANVENPARTGRDTALATPLDGLDEEQQCIVAAALAFQRSKPRPHRELAFLRLTRADQRIALTLSAALTLAEQLHGVDSAALVTGDEAAPVLLLAGKTAKQRVEHAQTALERWQTTVGPLELRVARTEELSSLRDGLSALSIAPPAAATITLPTFIPDALRGDEPLAEGVRRILRRQFERMLGREDDVRNGEDIEDVHQMRVATRRLRASLQIVEPYFDPQVVRRFRRGLREVAAALGAVRDRDVLLEDLHKRDDPTLARVIAKIEADRAAVREELLADFDHKRYRKFKHDFAVFLTSAGAHLAPLGETGVPPRVRDAAGALIYRRYEDLRAFEVHIPHGPDEVLHRARIAGKRLRYTLELFSDALGPRADAVLDPLAELQGALGDLQDAAVAVEHVAHLGLGNDPGVHLYQALRTAEGVTARAVALPLWRKIVGAAYRRTLLGVIARI